MKLHHVQVAMPAGGEEEARTFYHGVLGLREIVKPPALAARGGCWFALDGRTGLGTDDETMSADTTSDSSLGGELHLGVEDPFQPARKAHPALLVAGLEALAALRQRLDATGTTTRTDVPLPGYARFYVDDPFGNRLEMLAHEENNANVTK